MEEAQPLADLVSRSAALARAVAHVSEEATGHQHARGEQHARGSFAACPFIACMPARDEAERIGTAILALGADLDAADGIVVVVNGSTDDTLALARQALDGLAQPSVLLDVAWQAGEGTAPLARRLAMDLASSRAPGAALFSTDADTRVLPGLRQAYGDAFADGMAMACGAIRFDPRETPSLGPGDPEAEEVVRLYRLASREIAALIDPDPDNPWPHHFNIGGANFALTGQAYRLLGGLPTPPFGEERALLRLARGFGLRIRYTDAPAVITSCRMIGRAPGGLADELRRSREEADPLVDELLEPADLLRRRLTLGRALKVAGEARGARGAALDGFGLTDEQRAAILTLEPHGIAFMQAEDWSPVLRRRRMRHSDLVRELPALIALRDRLRAGAEGPADSAARAPS